MRTVFATLLTLLAATAASADGLSGTEDAALQEAVALWLSDDDSQSLPALSALAAEGNQAARLLLSQIEHAVPGASAYALGLSREARMALFRSPQNRGPFHATWMRVEADAGLPLAQHFRKTRSVERSAESAAALAAAGEPRAAAFYRPAAPMALDADGMQQLFPRLHPRVAAAGAVLSRKLQTQSVAATEAETKAAVDFLTIGLPYHPLDPGNPWYSAVTDWILDTAETQPIHRACARACPDSLGTCSVLLLGLTGGHAAATALSTPLENAIPQMSFLNSARAEGIAARRAAQALPAPAWSWFLRSDTAAGAACTVSWLSEIRAGG